MKRKLILAIVALAVSMLTAVTPTMADHNSHAPQNHGGGGGGGPTLFDIEVENFKFDPNVFPKTDEPFPADGIVVWFNKEGRHNVSICSIGGFDDAGGCTGGGVLIFSEDIRSGKTTSFSFASLSGTFSYFCRFHAASKNMVGTVLAP